MLMPGASRSQRMRVGEVRVIDCRALLTARACCSCSPFAMAAPSPNPALQGRHVGNSFDRLGSGLRGRAAGERS